MIEKTSGVRRLFFCVKGDIEIKNNIHLVPGLCIFQFYAKDR